MMPAKTAAYKLFKNKKHFAEMQQSISSSVGIVLALKKVGT